MINTGDHTRPPSGGVQVPDPVLWKVIGPFIRHPHSVNGTLGLTTHDSKIEIVEMVLPLTEQVCILLYMDKVSVLKMYGNL